jgi:serine/threonine protein kinase
MGDGRVARGEGRGARGGVRQPQRARSEVRGSTTGRTFVRYLRLPPLGGDSEAQYNRIVLTTGSVLDGRYEILESIAEGGMGSVYRARRTLLGDEVAIKVMRADFATNASLKERFFRESRACAQLRHPNIVSILDFNVDAEDRPFLVMELLNGRSLRQEIAARGPLPLAEAVETIVPLCGALQLAHDRGILHRDLKPANIVAHDFGGGTRAHKIVDFGLAQIREASDATRLTSEHQFLGTISYASPEQLTGGRVDARSDIYSLGVVVYELITGRVPFPGTEPMAVVTALLTKASPSPSSLRDDLPPWVDLVLARALAKGPSDRFESMAAFARALTASEPSDRPTVIIEGASRSAGGLLTTYDLGRKLGPGRLGSDVFLGTHRALGHPVAIRMLRRGPDRNWNAVRARFLREARTLQVAHPSIIQVRDYGEEGDLVYLVTDYIEGASLREVLTREGPMAWERLRPLLAQLTEAARVLHRRNGLLCGSNPDIMRLVPDEDGERLMISTAGVWDAEDLLATLRDQTVRGTALADVELRYVAPELLTGRSADVRSDVFTMGVLAYEMATGSLPYDGASMPSLLGVMLRGRPVDPRDRQPTLPAAAAAAVLKALAAEPDERFATAREFGGALLA